MANKPKKVELVLPAGNIESLRAAVNNGADGVYLGLKKFNARQTAGNFNEDNIFSAIKYCHDHNVKAYATFNTLIKNSELGEFLSQINIAVSAGVDAIIVQDTCLIPLIRDNFPGIRIHLSTQATVTNELSVPKNTARVVLARELSYEEIKKISQKHETEVFVHGALCFSYSGQCLLSSLAGGRSGNRGMCAQPCRKKYNNKFTISTMDLCMLEKIPELIEAGIAAFKVEGRMRSPLYVATVARIYRKAIDSYYAGNFTYTKEDLADLRVAFNREFTTGFAYNDSIVDSKKPMNRGLYLGSFRKGNILLKESLKVGDGISIWYDTDKIVGHTVKKITRLNHPGNDPIRESVTTASAGDIIEIDTRDAPEKAPVYKTSSIDLKAFLGKELPRVSPNVRKFNPKIPETRNALPTSNPQIFAKAYSSQAAIELDKKHADVIYYDVMKDDIAQLRKYIKKSKFFVYTPRILSDEGAKDIIARIEKIKPDGVLVGNRGLLKLLSGTKLEIHLDYSFNIFNDINISYYRNDPGFNDVPNGILPIISPELNFKEQASMHDKNFIVLTHGNLVAMNTKEKLKAPELVDEEGRHFRVREEHGTMQVLNSAKLGLFNRALDYKKEGIRYFFIDIEKEPGKFIVIYRKILNGERFDDTRIRKGYTTGHFARGAY